MRAMNWENVKRLLLRYISDDKDRPVVFAAVTTLITGAIGIATMILGLFLFSVWLIVNATFYLLLSAMRAQAIKKYFDAKKIEDSQEGFDVEYTLYKHSGILLFLLGSSYMLVCMRMSLYGDATIYKGYMAYAFTIIAFVKSGLAIYGTVIANRIHNPVISTLKTINSIDAMVSMVVTTCTLLALTAYPYAINRSAILGMAFSAWFVLKGILMLSKRKGYKLKNENGQPNKQA